MTDIATGEGRPVWVDLSTSDPAAARAFYADVFGWRIDVQDEEQYGGYGMARLGGEDVAGIGPAQPGAPTAWSLYIGTNDVAGLAERIEKAGGHVIAPAFDVGDVGRMAVFEDPAGAFISGWEPKTMPGFGAGTAGIPGAYRWAELNARGFAADVAFYRDVFGWTTVSRSAPGGPDYTEFQKDGAPIAGGMEMSPMVPADVPSYWMIYFGVDDVGAAFKRALAAGAREMVGPTPFPGGRFAILSDPQGAVFALHEQGQRPGSAG